MEPIPLTEEERTRITSLLCSFGIPDERHAQYLADVMGMVQFALDTYFEELKNTVEGNSLWNKQSSTPESPPNAR